MLAAGQDGWLEMPLALETQARQAGWGPSRMSHALPFLQQPGEGCQELVEEEGPQISPLAARGRKKWVEVQNVDQYGNPSRRGKSKQNN
ncbi:hypothetical protein P7K49_030791 [Saguinus oedipus]|uniref:Uncharacterized protein n=1 Tax=Saguinus oedipus TaxID=9490 RepID=A0ABQ9U584_SAGOE|nr:hypothetical protein P7K49_030791 [Saguinus oedipus]